MMKLLIASFALVSLSVMIHTVGLVLLADWLIRHPLMLQQKFRIMRTSGLLTSVFAFIIFLHLIETLVWAGFYDLWKHFSDLETSWYFSMGSYTTIGYGDVVLPAKWRMLGGVEGITGVLLCGLSTAFLFVIVSRMFAKRIEHQSSNSQSDVANDVR